MSAVAPWASAQYGGRQRDRGDTGACASRQGGDNARATTQLLLDPAVAIERELPSLRIDLKLTTDQTPLFDSFER